MSTHLFAILGLGLACGLWVLVQRWIRRRDQDQPGVEGKNCEACGDRTEGCDAGGCQGSRGCGVKGER